MVHPIPDDENARLAALREYGLLDTPQEEAFDRITRLTARIFNTSTALITLVAENRQYLKACTGFTVMETPREMSFCAHLLRQPDVLVISDTYDDPTFRHHPFVTQNAPFTQPAPVRFYAGAPLRGPAGHTLGTLCVLDAQPRGPLSDLEKGVLRDLASLVMDEFELRRLQRAASDGGAFFTARAARSNHAVLILDTHGRVIDANARSAATFGYDTDALLGKRIDALINHAWQAVMVLRMDTTCVGEMAPAVSPTQTRDLRATRSDGTSLAVEMFVASLPVQTVPIPFSAMAPDQPSERNGRMGWVAHSDTVDPHRDAALATAVDVQRFDGYGLVIRDPARRRKLESDLYRLARLDRLTEMANRDAFLDRLNDIISERRAPSDLLLIDLHEFRMVADSWGPTIGDQLMQVIANRVREITCNPEAVDHAQCMAGRVGENAFGILLWPVPEGDKTVSAQQHPGRSTTNVAEKATMMGQDFLAQVRIGPLCDRLIAAIGRPASVQGHSVSISACIGSASFPADAKDANEWLSNADLALFQAKASDPATYRFFVPSLRETVLRRRILEYELGEAVENGQLELFYQPQGDLATGEVLGAEALLRWRHPSRGLLAPIDFLDVLESTALAATVGERIIATACEQAARWRNRGFPQFRMSVNLFGRQVTSGNLVSQVMTPLARFNLPPDAIEIELTESTILRRDSVTLEPLRELRNAGVRIAFDDYGTGYASLSLLKDFPLTRLKIDRAFVTNLVHDAADAAVVQAIIFLAKHFGLHVIAEGVETEEQAVRLRQFDCPQAQGYLYGKPVSAEEFELRHLRMPHAFPSEPQHILTV
ncbi:sensor domain-containing phosphodiesterase [Robbsia andropogonis]|uniref:sensor domain-containing phosphodiesterase n=1 Tax=Robbsia andropogonis TaxID=28092 RepID=UPI003D1DED03